MKMTLQTYSIRQGDEKLTTKLSLSDQVRNAYFVTEYGLYEILMRSTKQHRTCQLTPGIFYDLMYHKQSICLGMQPQNSI